MPSFSPKAAPPAGARPRGGWRGKHVDPQKVVRHRWQKDWTSQTDRTAWQQHRGRLKLALLLAAALGLTGYFVWLLLFAPVQTPLVAVVSTQYDWPLPPNAFAKEDLAAIRSHLDGQNLQIVDAAAGGSSREQVLQGLQRSLKIARADGSRSKTLIVYISMHGAVNGWGEPCLIPPGASPLNAETWLPVSTLLELIREQDLPADLHKLLVFDCNRIFVNWNAGVLCNTFAEHLQQLIEKTAAGKQAIPNLVVLNSTGIGESGRHSPQLGHSVFGHYLRLGLAGAADELGEGGNDDRSVSLHELHRYLVKHVDQWVRHHQAAAQRPMLLPADAPDVAVAWSVRRHPSPTQPPAPAVNTAEMADLWQAHDRLSKFEPLRFDPLAWRDLEHRLLWLEQLASAGTAYEAVARRTHDELLATVARMTERASKHRDSAAGAIQNPFTARDIMLPPEAVVHSLPLAERLGTMDREALAAVRSSLLQFMQAPSEQSLQAALETADALEAKGTPPLDEVHFLRMLHSFAPEKLPAAADDLRQVLELRAQTSRLAVPADERVQPWIRPLVDVADQTRRQAEDLLFAHHNGKAGSSTADEVPLPPEVSIDDLSTTAAAACAAAEKLAHEVAQAYSVRDRVYADLPYLSQWLMEWIAHPRSDEALQGFDEHELEKTLLNLIAATHHLSNSLEQAESYDWQSPEARPAFAAPLKQVEDHYAALRLLFDKTCETLAERAPSRAGAWRDLNQILALPLLPRHSQRLGLSPAQQRMRLHDVRQQIAAELRRSFRPGAQKRPAASEGSNISVDLADHLEQIIDRWDTHPALAILDSDLLTRQPAAFPAADHALPAPPAADGKPAMSHLEATCVRQGQSVRQALADLPRRLPVYGQAMNQAADSRLSTALPSTLDNWKGAERRVRAAASIAFPSPEDDPVARLRQLNLQQLLLWNMARTLDDFWGPAPGRRQSFFEIAVHDHLGIVEWLLEGDSALRKDVDGVRRMLTRRRAAAGNALTTISENVLLLEEAAQLTTTITVEPGAAGTARDLPEGVAAVLLGDVRGIVDGAVRPLPVPLDSAAPPKPQQFEFEFLLDPAALGNRGPNLEAVAWFRGHRYASPVMLSRPAGATVAVRPQPRDDAQITLSGNLRKPAALIFVLDCSASMQELMSVEGAPERVSRLGVAKNALNRMLDELAELRDARVGVLFYGHRAGWTTEQTPKLRLQKSYTGPIPDNLQPYDDVEIVRRLGRFDAVEAGIVAARLESVIPWGETPLYLSLTEALQQFPSDPETEKSIIAITDGVNYQRNPTLAKSPSSSQVVAAANDRDVRIHLIGFGIESSQASQARQSFTAIADQTDGSYKTAEDATSLVETLLSHLGPTDYTVAGDTGTPQRAEIGAPIAIDRARGGRYVVEVDSLSETVTLNGGESVELEVTRDGSRLVVPPYRTAGAPYRPLVVDVPDDGVAQSGTRLYAHSPVRSADGVEFVLSIQDEDRRFTARPVEVWVEITPLAPDTEASPARYLFYDAVYAPDTPVPVLRLAARDWPANADRARIELWCKDEISEPVARVSLTDIANRPPKDAVVDLPGTADVTFPVRLRVGEDCRVDVIEHYADRAADVYALKLDIVDGPTPQQILRRFDPTHGVVTHTFRYAAADAAAVSNASLQITPRAAVQRGARRLSAPIVIDISAAGDTVPTLPGPRLP